MKVKILKRYTGKEGDMHKGMVIEIHDEQRLKMLVAQGKAELAKEEKKQVKDSQNKSAGPKETK